MRGSQFGGRGTATASPVVVILVEGRVGEDGGIVDRLVLEPRCVPVVAEGCMGGEAGTIGLLVLELGCVRLVGMSTARTPLLLLLLD